MTVACDYILRQKHKNGGDKNKFMNYDNECVFQDINWLYDNLIED